MGENPVLEGVAVVGGESYFVLILHQSVLSNEAMIYYIIFCYTSRLVNSNLFSNH